VLLKKFKTFLGEHWWVILTGVVLVLRVPSLFEPFTYGDEGVYLTLGQGIKKGLLLYKEIHDNKPPLIYLVAELAGNFEMYRLIFFLWAGVTIFAFHKLTGVLFKNKAAKAITTSVFAVLYSLPLLEGNIANAENYMVLLTIWGFYKLVKAKSAGDYLWVGVMFAMAILFKVPAGFDVGAVLVLIITTQKEWRKIIGNSFWVLAGVMGPILITVAYFAGKGAGREYLMAAFAQNLPYLSSWGTSSHQSFSLPIGLMVRFGMVIIGVVLIFYYRNRLEQSLRLVLLWFGFAWFAALLSGRPYPHYMLQVLPAFALAWGWVFSTRLVKVIPYALLVVSIVTWLGFKFWHYKNLQYYNNFYSYAVGKKNWESYGSYFSPQVENIYELADYLGKRTVKDERVFIWGNQPEIYALAYRLPVGKYTVAYHIIDFEGYKVTIDALKAVKPRYVVIYGDEKRPFLELNIYVATNYQLEKNIQGIAVYHLLP